MDTPFTSSPPEYPEVQLLKIGQVADILAISGRNVYYLIDQGEIPAVIIGGSKRVRYLDLVKFVEAHLEGEK